MKSSCVFPWCLASLFGLTPLSISFASELPPPVIQSLSATGGVVNLRFAPYPAAQSYSILSAPDAGSPFTPNTNFVLSPYITGYTVITNNTINGPVVMTVTNYAYEWRNANATGPSELYQVFLPANLAVQTAGGSFTSVGAVNGKFACAYSLTIDTTTGPVTLGNVGTTGALAALAIHTTGPVVITGTLVTCEPPPRLSIGSSAGNLSFEWPTLSRSVINWSRRRSSPLRRGPSSRMSPSWWAISGASPCRPWEATSSSACAGRD